MASPSYGAGPHPDHESVASGGAERRSALQEEVVAKRAAATGIVPVGSMGEPATARSVGAVGSVEPDYRGAKPGSGTRSGEVPWGAATGDPSRCRSTHRDGIRANHRGSGTLSMWQAGGQLSRSGSNGRLQRQSPAVGTYHQARQFDIALPTGGSGAGNSAQSSGMAQPILSPDDAAGTEDRQDRHGTPIGRLSVLDDAPGMGLSAVD